MNEGQAGRSVPLTGAAPRAEVPAGYKRTEAGVSPEDWDTAALGEVVDIRNGATPSTHVSTNWDGSIPWCTPTDITNTSGKYLTKTARRITEKGLADCGTSLLPAGTLLLCSRATIGEIKIASFPVCTNQGFKSLICAEQAHNEFLYYLALTLKPRLIQQAIGSTFLEIGKKALVSIEIRLPPLKEQRSIAEALSDVDGLLESLGALIAKKQTVKETAMQQLLTGKTRLPGFSGKWLKEFIGKIGFIYSGLSGKSKMDFSRGQAKYVTFLNVLDHVSISIDDPSLFDDVAVGSEEKQNKVLSGDLLFNNTSETPDDLAMGSAVQVDIPELYLNSFCFGFRLYNSSRYNPLYLAYSFRGPIGRKLMYALAQGATRYNISKQQFLNLELRIPEIREQIAIATILSDMDAEIAALERRLNKIRAIKQNAMQQLLTGRIRLARPL